MRQDYRGIVRGDASDKAAVLMARWETAEHDTSIQESLYEYVAKSLSSDGSQVNRLASRSGQSWQSWRTPGENKNNPPQRERKRGAENA